ncbi:MAG: NYN domain-containing protein [Acidaminococcaceae bacterium]|nr:NYN domain-containing protein [Acidaminococcaceae bacterium]
MKEYYLVDGYNVINNWPDFAGVRDQDLEHARAMLADKVAEFSAFHGYDAVLVFDAMDVKGPEAAEFTGGCMVVYTAEQETADSWIERETYRIAKRGTRVFVVTSDKAEQDNVLGSGALRISAREFREMYYKAKKEIEERIVSLPGNTGRREIGGRIGGDVASHLERLRRG